MQEIPSTSLDFNSLIRVHLHACYPCLFNGRQPMNQFNCLVINFFFYRFRHNAHNYCKNAQHDR